MGVNASGDEYFLESLYTVVGQGCRLINQGLTMASSTPEDITAAAKTAMQTDVSAAEVDSPKEDLAAPAEVPAQEVREVRNSL